MWTKSSNLEVVALLVLIFIPWPGPTIFKISCPRDSATVVRKVVQKKWIPILEKRNVQLGVECPFHPSRDIFGTQQAAKQQYRASQWTCAFCGKSFYTERHLDAHFDSRHRDTINVAEDAVCLADYCDVMRCEVVAGRDEDAAGRGTDVEVWRHRTALSVTPPRDLARVSKGAAIPSLKAPFARQKQQSSPRCPPPSSSTTPPSTSRTSPPSPASTPGSNAASSSSSSSRGSASGAAARDGDANATADVCAKADLVDSSLPPHLQQHAKAQEMQRLKADCKPEELLKLKTRCEILVRDCIAGLLVNLSIQDFKEIEDELNRVSCWYLTCERYWEDSPADARTFPWALLGSMCTMLAIGVLVCYYIIWVLFDSDEAGCDSPTPRHPRGPRGVLRGGMLPGGGAVGGGAAFPHQYYPGDLDGGEQYIYVSYPPDLKRRLQERNSVPLASVPPANGRPISAPSSTGLGPPAQTQQQQQQQHLHQQYHRPAMTPAQQQHYQLQQLQQLQQQQQYQQHLAHMQHLARANAAQHAQHAQQRQDPFEREWKI